MTALRRRAATVFTTVASLSGAAGPHVPHYAFVLQNARVYKWVPDDSSTADAWSIVTHTGGEPGRWIWIAGDELGADLTDASATLTVDGKLLRYLPAATLSANRTLTLSTTGAVAGLIWTIVRLDVGAWTVAFVNGGVGAGTLATMPVSKQATCDFVFDGTNWRLLRACIQP